MSDLGKYSEIFDYLSARELPESAEAAVVFGRQDPLVAYALGDLIIPGLVEVAIITGGVGKDSGDILKRGFRSEADYLNHEVQADAVKRDYKLPEVILEEKATNGGENARHSLAILLDRTFGTDTLTAVAHATSARRLAETLKFETEKETGSKPVVHIAPTAYDFNPLNPLDRQEAGAELLRLADWPTRGLLGPQPDIPEDLVDFIRGKHS